LSVVARWLLHLLCVIAIAATVAALAMTFIFIRLENSWAPSKKPTPDSSLSAEQLLERNEMAFFHGTIGTEVVPLPVIKVLPAMFPEHFQPRGKDAGDWVQQFGFIPSARVPVKQPQGESLEGLPLGFTISNYRPKSGAPSPVKFVGLGCATCHTTLVRRGNSGEDPLVIGTGNTALNLFAWLDAFQAALLDEKKLTMDTFESAYRDSGGELSFAEKTMISIWLKGTRAKIREDAEKFDEPYGHGLSIHPDIVPTGQARTQPFRTLVRTALLRPGATMKVYTKIASVFWQELEHGRGQFDGGILGLPRRSSGAAFAAGATVQNMNIDEIAGNINWASDYLNRLKGKNNGKVWKFAEMFPGKAPESKAVENGKTVYQFHCSKCHGQPDDGGNWISGKMQGQMTVLETIGTDSERVTFRYYERIPDALSKMFPKGHYFDFPREDLFPSVEELAKEDKNHLEKYRGYINKPIPLAFLRSPYLHNGSVLTLKELINLAPRRQVFYRGENAYDADAVGLLSDNKQGPQLYFKFDTNIVGNSNKGHDYPWPRPQVKGNQEKQKALEDLLAYLKTF